MGWFIQHEPDASAVTTRSVLLNPAGLSLHTHKHASNSGQPCGIQKYAARCDCRRRDCHRLVLDEPSIQLSGYLVAYLDGTHLQNLSGVLESGKPRAKYRADFARSRLAIEMDRFAARGDRRLHDVLSPAVPKTNRRRTDHAFGSEKRKQLPNALFFPRGDPDPAPCLVSLGMISTP